MRRITTGIQGGPIIGSLTTLDNTIKSIETNDDIIFEPNGTGETKFGSNIMVNAAAVMKYADSDSSNFVGLKSPNTLAGDYTLTLPLTDADVANKALVSDGSGQLSWAATEITISDNTTDAATYYPLISTSTSGGVTGLNVSSSKLTFQPSTGTTQTAIVRGGTGASNNLVLRSTSNGSKGQVYVDESTASSTTATGALRVAGGLGVGGQLTAATIVETSSIVFKENINPLESALDKITKLAGVMYDRKDGSTKGEVGLIAEDTYKVIPNVVTKDEKGDIYGIQYTKLSAYIIEAIKELRKEITDLKGNG